MDSLAQKTLVMIVGPAAIGKTTLMNTVIELDDTFSYVRSFTSRKRRANEISHYDFISRDTARTLYENKQSVTYFEHPTTGDIYGTTTQSYQTSYNLLDTLSTTVSEYRMLPFAQTITISLTAEPEQWKTWFLRRYPTKTTEAEKRLHEAQQSIAWSIHDPDTYWLTNLQDETEQTARELISIVKHNSSPQPAPDTAHALLSMIQRGIY